VQLETLELSLLLEAGLAGFGQDSLITSLTSPTGPAPHGIDDLLNSFQMRLCDILSDYDPKQLVHQVSAYTANLASFMVVKSSNAFPYAGKPRASPWGKFYFFWVWD